MAINTKDLIDLVIRPTLVGIGLNSEAAIQLLAGTCAQESQMGTNLRQIEGSALGIFQVENATHRDINVNYLKYWPDLQKSIFSTCGMISYMLGNIPDSSVLVYNLRYAAAIARIKYARVKDKLPALGDIEAQATYWKTFYNTSSGKGDVTAYMTNYERFIKSYYG